MLVRTIEIYANQRQSASDYSHTKRGVRLHEPAAPLAAKAQPGTPIIAMTTSNSIKVNAGILIHSQAGRRLFLLVHTITFKNRVQATPTRMMTTCKQSTTKPYRMARETLARTPRKVYTVDLKLSSRNAHTTTTSAFSSLASQGEYQMSVLA